MKLNIKNILVIFLVAILGSAIGTFSIIEFKKEDNPIRQIPETQVVQVNYPPIEHGDYEQAIAKAYDSVVEIVSTSTVSNPFFFMQSEATSMGSGVIISPDGYIVTNNHVVTSSTGVKVKLSNGEEYDAQIIGTDSRCDLAVVKIDAKDLPYSLLAESKDLAMGMEVITIGNPLGEGISCSNGIISALNKEVTINGYHMTLIQTNAAVNEGNSGGGLFNMNGDLIGIVNAKSSSSSFVSSTVEGIGYAIPSDTVARITANLIDYGYVKDRATIGIKVYTSSNPYISNTEGAMISEVVEGSPAEKAGMKAGDVIIQVDDIKISSYSDLTAVLDSYEIGDQIKCKVVREDKEIDFKLQLSESMN